MIYFNGMNLAIKVSNKITQNINNVLDTETLNFINNVKDQLENFDVQMKFDSFSLNENIQDQYVQIH